MTTRVRVFAPATVANVGPGFDVLGLALEEPGDVVEAWLDPGVEGVHLDAVTGDGGALPTEVDRNSAGVAARAAWGLLPGPRPGLRLRLEKGTPLSSGMGSSAASAVAGAFAVHALFPGRVAVEDLLGPCLEAEAAVAGRHADNLAPALLGGMILVESCDPLRVHRIEPALDLHFVVAKPAVGVDTKAARAAIPDALPRADAVAQLGAVAGLVHALHAGDLELAVRSIRDRVAEPYRKHLVPAFDAVHAAALGAGARACSISGAGPALFALLDDPGKAPGVGAAMVAAWKDAGVEARAWSSPLAKEGARVL